MFRYLTFFCLLAGPGAILAQQDTEGATPAFEVSAPVKVEAGDVRTRLYRSGPAYIGGQPEASALERLAGDGVAVVINLRTPGEVSYDEQQVAEELGMEYVAVPLGGDYQFTPEALEQAARAIDRHDGQVLLHCRSGRQASSVWAAYLVKYRGVSLEDAYAQGRAIGIDEMPMEGLLDRELTLRYRDE